MKLSTGEREFRCYFNGGGVFVDAEKLEGKGVEVMARYAEPLDIEEEAGKVAVVYCQVGEGAAILTGPHPEYVTLDLYHNHADGK